MALLYLDSFEHYQPGAPGGVGVEGIWVEHTNLHLAIVPYTSAVGGGTSAPPGTGSKILNHWMANQFRVLAPGGVRDRIGIAAHVFLDSPDDDIGQTFAFFIGNQVQLAISIDSSAKIKAVRGGLLFNPGETYTVAASADGVVPIGTWFWLEAWATIDASAGSVEIRINGSTVASGTGNTTRPGIDGGVHGTDGFGFFNPATVMHFSYKNLIVMDDQGGVHDDFIGEHIVQTLWPDALISPGDFYANVGTLKEAMDDIAPDDSSTYIQSDSTFDSVMFSMQNIDDLSFTVTGAMVLSRNERIGTGSGEVKMSIDVDGIISSGVPFTLQSSWYSDFSAFDRPPGPGIPEWSRDIVNRVKVKLSKEHSNEDAAASMRSTQVVLLVITDKLAGPVTLPPGPPVRHERQVISSFYPIVVSGIDAVIPGDVDPEAAITAGYGLNYGFYYGGLA